MTTSLPVRAGIFFAAAAVTSIFFIQFCATVFQCGCQEIWGLAATHCNIHNPTARHCPFCVYGALGYSAVFGSMVLAQAAAVFLPGAWTWKIRLLAAMAAFPFVGALLAVLFGLSSGYWK
jgi:hypothetical protein